VATVGRPVKLSGRLIASRRVELVCGSVGKPVVKSTAPGDRAGPLLPPEACLLDRAPQPRGIGLPLGVVIAGKGRRTLHDPARGPEGPRGRLPPWSLRRDTCWPRAPSGNWPCTALSTTLSHCRAVQGVPAEYPTICVGYQARPISTQPTPSTRPVGLAMPHPSFGGVGRGLRPVGVRWALSRRCGVTSHGWSRSRRRIRVWLTTCGATSRRSAQSRRYPQTGGSALSARLHGSSA